MDGDKVSPVSPVTMQVLNGLIDAQTKLRDAAEKRWSVAREALFNLARLVAADWLEERLQQKGGLEVVRIEELSQVVFERVSTLRSAHIHPNAEQVRNVLARIDALHQEVEKFTLLANGYKSELDNANLEIAHLKTQAEDKKGKPAVKVIEAVVRKVTPAPSRDVIPPEPVDPEFQASSPAPAWFQKWAASEGFEKQSFVIRLMGDTGLSVRPEIMKALTTKYDAARTSGACVRAFNYLVDNLFIITGETDGGLPGHPPQTVRLGPLGETAYQLMTGKRSVKATFDEIRSAHGTDAHTLLILKVGSILEAEDYEIISMGEMEFTLPDGRITSPDILAKSKRNGKEIHVEVERNTGKGDPAARERKWQSAFDAGQGFLYVFCESEKIQKNISQEINHALASEARLERANIFMNNLDSIAANQRHPDGSIWVSQKRS
ncbi:MAG: hypothetical protein NT121_19745 [Chloroflexi bacterium]|nr:hypothetical protein [Chloroflexota bacterium]